MNSLNPNLRAACCALCLLTGALALVQAQETNRAALPIDLPTALRLAGAQNLDVQIAQAKLAEARANQDGAVAQFFPWIAPGISYSCSNIKTPLFYISRV